MKTVFAEWLKEENLSIKKVHEQLKIPLETLEALRFGNDRNLREADRQRLAELIGIDPGDLHRTVADLRNSLGG